ncbi:hypothetical protein ACP70R_021385 [Stipagrostis hirtigluma subsp. patula]
MGSANPAADPIGLLRLRHPGALSRRAAMARDGATAAAAAVAPALRPWLVDLVPLLVVLLIAAHVLALGYWIYRLATDGSRQPARSKKH